MPDEGRRTGAEGSRARPSTPRQPSFVSEFVPNLVTALRQGYSVKAFGRDALAGLTVAILALPLSMAIAIGTGTTPDRGLITSVVAGFFISLLGGSRYQVGGPAAAFIVINAAVIAQHGISGLMTATFLAGFILILAALFRLGTFIKYVPGPVILGFTSAIGFVIAVGQLKDLLGLQGTVPADIVHKIPALWALRPTFSWQALAVGLGTLATISACKAWRPAFPGLLVAVVGASFAAWALGLRVETIGSRFGGIPNGLPAPALPDLSWPTIVAVLPSAFTIAFLVGVESLLSAVAADAKTGDRHRSNVEVLAQGIANAASPLFGGLPATGVIARTATNISAGAVTPMSGVLHAVFALLFMLLAAPLAYHLALPCLAAVLLNVSWRLMDFREVSHFLQRAPFDDRLILVATLALTILVDLNVAIAVGVGLACVLFMHRMAEVSGNGFASVGRDPETQERLHATAPFQEPPLPAGVQIFYLRGPLFFGGAAAISAAVRELPDFPRVLILRMRDVPLIDSTALSALEDVAGHCRRQNCRIVIAGLQQQPRQAMHRLGFLRSNKVVLASNGYMALEKAKALLANQADA